MWMSSFSERARVTSARLALSLFLFWLCVCLWCVHALRNDFLTKNPPLFVFCNSDTCTSTRLKNLHPACFAICPCLSACKYPHTSPQLSFRRTKTLGTFVCVYVINQLLGPVRRRRLFSFCTLTKCMVMERCRLACMHINLLWVEFSRALAIWSNSIPELAASKQINPHELVAQVNTGCRSRSRAKLIYFACLILTNKLTC